MDHPQRVCLDIPNGAILIGSDAHIWPGPTSTAMRAFIKFSKELKPKAVILNGDVMDFPKISRHPRIGWEQLPEVRQELDAARVILDKIEKAAPRARKIWTLGNHDARFESLIANKAPEYKGVFGVHLKDHFPKWECGWSCWVNDVVVKHRFKGGDHAAFNNAVKSGRSIVTGHLHSAKVSPVTDFNGTRWGVDSGCLADVSAKPFIDYTEDNPLNWRSGFAVLTFKNGKLLPPELVHVWDCTTVVFRGEIIRV
jgi:hypothetical protein